jgi:8-oxo-dGTP pyrophosphatase MutT (NUDIX family)
VNDLTRVPALAATVVLLRPSDAPAAASHEPEVLLIERPASMAFGPGIHVFPGGRVDPGDGDPSRVSRSTRSADAAAEALAGMVESRDAAAIHVAAVRELHEEVGILLADGSPNPTVDPFGGSSARLRTDLLVPIAHWTTPAFMPRRFSTWFFVADLPPESVLSFATDEVAGHRWLTPSDALEAMAAGEIEMWIPTVSVLERLIEAGANTAPAVGERIRLSPPGSPSVTVDDPDRLVLTTFESGGLPGRRCETTLLGRREIAVVDPGDASDTAIDAIRSAVERRNGNVTAIVLTATDPDHAAAAEALAIPLALPVMAPRGGGRHLPYEVVELADGDQLPIDVEVRVRLGPGPTLSLGPSRSAGE